MKIVFSISTSSTPIGVQALAVRRGKNSKPMFVVLKSGNKVEVTEFANGLNRDSVGKFSSMEGFLDLHYNQIRVFGTEYAFVRVSPSATFNYEVHGQPNQWDWASMDDDAGDDEVYSAAVKFKLKTFKHKPAEADDAISYGERVLNAISALSKLEVKDAATQLTLVAYALEAQDKADGRIAKLKRLATQLLNSTYSMYPTMRSLSLSEVSISDLVRQGKTLNAAQKESLINLLCKGARGNTRIDITSMVKYGNIAKWESVGISTDRLVFTGDVAEYVAGQSYPDEIKNIRKALTKMRKG